MNNPNIITSDNVAAMVNKIATTVDPVVLEGMDPLTACTVCTNAFNANENLRIHYSNEASEAERIYKGAAPKWAMGRIAGTDREYWKNRAENFQKIANGINHINHEIFLMLSRIDNKTGFRIVNSNYSQLHIVF